MRSQKTQVALPTAHSTLTPPALSHECCRVAKGQKHGATGNCFGFKARSFSASPPVFPINLFLISVFFSCSALLLLFGLWLVPRACLFPRLLRQPSSSLDIPRITLFTCFGPHPHFPHLPVIPLPPLWLLRSQLPAVLLFKSCWMKMPNEELIVLLPTWCLDGPH